MQFLARLPSILFDPRGRMSRAELLISAVAVIAVEALLAFAPAVQGAAAAPLLAAKACSFWIGLAALIKRLHDLGLSAWWALAGAGGLCIWTALLAIGFFLIFGPDALSPGSLGLIAVFGLVMLPAIGATLWLHVAPGEAETNRFGAPPAIAGQQVAPPQSTASV